MNPISFTLPIRLVAASNAREHWRAIAARKKEQRSIGALWTRGVFRELTLPGRKPGKFVVTITRIGKRRMDDDNLAGSAKYLRDGIADALGIDDGDTKRVMWCYAQEIGKGYAVRVAIEVA